MINNTNDDSKDLIRKLSSSIIFDAQPSGDSIKIKCTATMNNRLPVVDNVAYRYRGTCMSHMLPPGGDCPQSLNRNQSQFTIQDNNRSKLTNITLNLLQVHEKITTLFLRHSISSI